MVALEPAAVVLVRFPFSDLSASKLRPAVVLARSGGVDWILCQVTSNPYGDSAAVGLTSFASGGLGRESFARPASSSLRARPSSYAGTLTSEVHRDLVERVVSVLRSGVK